MAWPIAPLYARLFKQGVVLSPHTELRAVEGSTVVVAELHAVDDFVAPRGVHQAILDGTRAARAI